MGLFGFLSRKKHPLSYDPHPGLKPLHKPSKMHAHKQLRRIAKALQAAAYRHEDFLESLRQCECLATDKGSQDALAAYVKEMRGLVDGLEICLLLLVSDYHQVDLRKPLRPFLERALKELQKAVE